jgi:hypothetical protein
MEPQERLAAVAPSEVTSAVAGQTGWVEIDGALVARLITARFPQWASLPISAAEPNGRDDRTSDRRGA